LKALNASLYERLTPQQRIIAAIEAEARDDRAELQRLVQTCPKKSYLMSDCAFSEGVQKLMLSSMMVELDLTRLTATYVLIAWLDKGDPDKCLDDMATIQAAWEEEVSEQGIDMAAMAKAGCPRHPIVECLLGFAEPADPAAVKELRERMATVEAEGFEV
jgi:hypothetical protein